MERVNVLVTGSGSLYGVAVIQSLVKSALNCYVVAADTNPMTLGLYLAHQKYLMPRADQTKAWLRKIVSICNQENIHAVFTGSSHEIETYARYSDYIFLLTGAKVFVHPQEVIDACLDKWQTMVFLKENGFYYPKTIRYPEDSAVLADFIKENAFPLVAKPRYGAGSQGLAFLNSMTELESFMKGKRNYIIQECLPADSGEFTVGVCVGADKKVLSAIALKRNLQDGMTMSALADLYPDICSYCERVATKLNAYGSINLQLRLKEKNPYIFEINPRFSSSTGMRIALGINEAELLIRSEILKEKVKKPTVKKAGVIRQYLDYVIPFEEISRLHSEL